MSSGCTRTVSSTGCPLQHDAAHVYRSTVPYSTAPLASRTFLPVEGQGPLLLLLLLLCLGLQGRQSPESSALSPLDTLQSLGCLPWLQVLLLPLYLLLVELHCRLLDDDDTADAAAAGVTPTVSLTLVPAWCIILGDCGCCCFSDVLCCGLSLVAAVLRFSYSGSRCGMSCGIICASNTTGPLHEWHCWLVSTDIGRSSSGPLTDPRQYLVPRVLRLNRCNKWVVFTYN